MKRFSTLVSGRFLRITHQLKSQTFLRSCPQQEQVCASEASYGILTENCAKTALNQFADKSRIPRSELHWDLKPSYVLLSSEVNQQKNEDLNNLRCLAPSSFSAPFFF